MAGHRLRGKKHHASSARGKESCGGVCAGCRRSPVKFWAEKRRCGRRLIAIVIQRSAVGGGRGGDKEEKEEDENSKDEHDEEEEVEEEQEKRP